MTVVSPDSFLDGVDLSDDNDDWHYIDADLADGCRTLCGLPADPKTRIPHDEAADSSTCMKCLEIYRDEWFRG